MKYGTLHVLCCTRVCMCKHAARASRHVQSTEYLVWSTVWSALPSSPRGGLRCMDWLPIVTNTDKFDCDSHSVQDCPTVSKSWKFNLRSTWPPRLDFIHGNQQRLLAPYLGWDWKLKAPISNYVPNIEGRGGEEKIRLTPGLLPVGFSSLAAVWPLLLGHMLSGYTSTNQPWPEST